MRFQDWADEPLPKGDEMATLMNSFSMLLMLSLALQSCKKKEEAATEFLADGTTWTERTLFSDGTYTPFIFGGGKFIAISTSTSHSTSSTDGINWEYDPIGIIQNWQSVAYGNGVYVAVGYSSSDGASSQGAISSDGRNWSSTTLPASSLWHSITFGGGKFVAVARSSATAAVSVDGINWTTATLPFDTQWNHVAHHNGMFLAVATGSTPSTTSTQGARSFDGEYWINVILPSNNWLDSAYGNGMFVVSGDGPQNYLAISTDGEYWNQESTELGLRPTSTGQGIRIEYGNGTFVFAASRAPIRISKNGFDWTFVVPPGGSNYAVGSLVFGNNMFLLIKKDSRDYLSSP